MSRHELKPPNELCIYNSSKAGPSFAFFDKINELAVKKGNQLLIDLSDVKEITAAASLVLFATANTAQLWAKTSNNVLFRFPREEKNPEGYLCIIKTGLARALHSGSEEKLRDLVVKGIFFQSSTNPAAHLISTLKFLTKEVDFTDDQMMLLSSGISEAMLNVSHHAYKDPLNNNKDAIHKSKEWLVERIGERWWQCAWYDELDKSWVFIICDLGIGIPKSFKNKNYIDSVFEVPGYLRDAFTLGASRYDGGGRGNGSEDMKRLITSFGSYEESLLVYSGGAQYYFSSKMTTPNIDHLSHYFHGTLIEWTLSTKKVGDS
jgi:hypothetical protein